MTATTRPQRVHANSRAAHDATLHERDARLQRIIDVFRRNDNAPLTVKQLERETGISRYLLAPRISDHKGDGELFEECDGVKENGRTVYRVRLRWPNGKQGKLF